MMWEEGLLLEDLFSVGWGGMVAVQGEEEAAAEVEKKVDKIDTSVNEEDFEKQLPPTVALAVASPVAVQSAPSEQQRKRRRKYDVARRKRIRLLIDGLGRACGCAGQNQLEILGAAVEAIRASVAPEQPPAPSLETLLRADVSLPMIVMSVGGPYDKHSLITPRSRAPLGGSRVWRGPASSGPPSWPRPSCGPSCRTISGRHGRLCTPAARRAARSRATGFAPTARCGWPNR